MRALISYRRMTATIGSLAMFLVVAFTFTVVFAQGPSVNPNTVFAVNVTPTPIVEPTPTPVSILERLSVQVGSLDSSGSGVTAIGRGFDPDFFWATFFNGADLGGGFVTSVAYTEPIDFYQDCWGESYPYAGCKLIDNLSDGQDYSIRWSSNLMAPLDGDYTFTLAQVDDGALIEIDGERVVDDGWFWPIPDQNPSPQTVSLTAGWHDITILYEQRIFYIASLQVRWSGPNFEDEIIPLFNPYECDPSNEGLSDIGMAVFGEVDSQPFCRNRYQGLSFTPGDPVGENTGFHDWAAMARSAQYEVLFTNMMYSAHNILKGDSPGAILAKEIAYLYEQVTLHPERYPEGLTIRILVGNQPSLFDQRYNAIADLYRHGVREMEIPGRWKLEVARYRNGPFSRAWSHAKFMVVDGKIVLAAGFNMTYEHIEDLVDFGVQVIGPIAQASLVAYDELWEGSKGLTCDLSTPIWNFTCEEYTVGNDHVPAVENLFITDGDINVFSLFRTDDPDHKEADRAVEEALNVADKSIEVMHMSFTLHDMRPLLGDFNFESQAPAYMRGLKEAIVQNDGAGNTGFKVRILNSPNDLFMDRWNFLGIKTFLEELGDLSRYVEIKDFDGKTHAKVSVIDGQFLIVGSQNWMFSAFGFDLPQLAEYSLGIDSSTAAQEFLDSYFDGGFNYWGSGRPRTIVYQDDDLKATIENASDGDVIVIYGDSFQLSEPIEINSEIRIVANGAKLSSTETAFGSPGFFLASYTPIMEEALLRINASNVELIGLHLQDSQGYGIAIGDGLPRTLENIYIGNALFENNKLGGVLINNGLVDLTIENNTFVGGIVGVEFRSVAGHLNTSHIRNNIFASQDIVPIFMFPTDGGNVEYSNNQFFGCEAGDCIANWHRGLLGPGSDAHDNLFDLDPLFRNPEVGDYRLSPGSPAIDAGDTEIQSVYIPDGDGDGIARIDMGAFEFLGIANQTPNAEADGPYVGDEGIPVTFDGSGSSDPDGDPLEFRWDFDGDGAFDTIFSPDSSAAFTFPDEFTGEATLEVRDDGSLVNSDTESVEIHNVAPTVSVIGDTVAEGETAWIFADFTDPGVLDTHEAEVDWGDGTPAEPVAVTQRAGFGSLTAFHTYGDDDTYVVMVIVIDNDGGVGEGTTDVEVDNVAPTVETIIAPADPVQLNAIVDTSAEFTDPGKLDSHTAVWEWGDGTTSPGVVDEADGAGVVTGNHTYSEPGIYTIQLTVTDKDGASGASIFQYIVVYNPEGGFVTGGGWIDSPAGAYASDPSLTDKANFGFNAKYKKGTTTPNGQTQFNLAESDLNFHSTSYQWLVITSDRAQFRGSGTINGEGEYGFMVFIIDGDLNDNGGADKFRIRIWDLNTSAIVYDNQMGDPEDADPTTILGGGSIVIQQKK